MRPIVVTVGPLATADADGICLSQTPTSGTALTLDGILVVDGVAVLDTPRRVLVTFGVEASARTMVIVGTDWAGLPISETVAIASGGGATIASVLDYATVESITPAGGGFSAAVTVGTNGVAGSPWVRTDWSVTNPNATVQLDATGTVNATVQVTLDDPNSTTDPVDREDVVWINSGTAALAGATGDVLGVTTAGCWLRVLLNSGSGSVRAIILQYTLPNG